jgi:hypothetical protein
MPVFKTGAINRSAISPKIFLFRLKQKKQGHILLYYIYIVLLIIFLYKKNIYILKSLINLKTKQFNK